MIDAARFAATGSAYDLPEPSFDADLALVTRGTPMGEMLRRYWHPVYVSSKLTDLPVQVKALGDEIILFRKPTGEVGAVYPRCVHRGTSLLWGKVTPIGIRCCYHGWTFETDGKCVSQPCEPNDGGKGKNAVRQPWYPVEERYGFIFVYLGPPDKKPPLPRYDVLESLPDDWEIIPDDTSIPSAGAGYMPCNWLQHWENGMDPHHVAILHEHQFPPIMAQAESVYEFAKDADRVRGHGISKIGPMRMDFKVELQVPNVTVIPNPVLAFPRPDGKCDSVSWALPVDNTDTIIFSALVRPLGAEPMPGDLYNGKSWKELTHEEHQRFPGDFEAQTGQGKITFHSEEHLVSADKGIVFLRRMLQAAVKDVAEGRDPPLSFGADKIMVETWSGMQMMPNPDYVDTEVADADAPITSAPAGSADGTWEMTIKTPMGDQVITVALTQSGDALTGVMTSDAGAPVIIADGKLNGANAKWSAKVEKPFSMTMKFDVMIDGDVMTGKAKPGMFPAASLTGKRLADG
jgi:phenylpropionate dioxygenase-like ring-hydroxylating dioxygenase large terminal subunit